MAERVDERLPNIPASSRSTSGLGRWFAPTLPVLDDSDRVEFERLIAYLRLTFLASPILVFLAFGPAALPFSLTIVVAVLASYGWVWVLATRAPQLLLRLQLWLRVLDCALVWMVLTPYHGYLGDAYYDVTYVLFVLAAAATHGSGGVLVTSAWAGIAVLSSRLLLMLLGILPVHARHFTDSVFYLLFFLAIGATVAYLMRRSAAVVARRDKLWRDELGQRNTALENAARQLQAANVQLASLASENERLLRRAQRAMEVRDQFFAYASHDLKNPLLAIDLQLQLFNTDLSRETLLRPTRLRDRLARIHDATRRLQNLADQFGDIALVGMGQKLPLDVAPVDLVELAQRVIALYPTAAGRHHLHLETSVETLVGEWDGARLERVLENLLGNALRYTPAGRQVTMEVHRGTSPSPDAYAEVVIRDQGTGIPAADLPHIFERFRRGGNVTGKSRGMGLGLPGAQVIVHEHGGTIILESKEGEGTTVIVRLPPHVPSNVERNGSDGTASVTAQPDAA